MWLFLKLSVKQVSSFLLLTWLYAERGILRHHYKGRSNRGDFLLEWGWSAVAMIVCDIYHFSYISVQNCIMWPSQFQSGGRAMPLSWYSTCIRHPTTRPTLGLVCKIHLILWRTGSCQLFQPQKGLWFLYVFLTHWSVSIRIYLLPCCPK